MTGRPPLNRADSCYSKGFQVQCPARNDGPDNGEEGPGYLFQEMTPGKDDDQDQD